MLKIGDMVKFTHMHDADLNTSYEKDMKKYLNKVGKVFQLKMKAVVNIQKLYLKMEIIGIF